MEAWPTRSFNRLRQAHGAALPAIATGGLARLFAEHIDGSLIVDADLI